MKINQIEVTFFLGKDRVSIITSDLLPTHELAAREFAGYAVRGWFERQDLPIPEFVRNVHCYSELKEYKWDILILNYLTSIKYNILEKIENVIRSLEDGYTNDDLVNKFMELYPKDYERYMRQYEYDKNKKKNPMPHPDELILSARDLYLIINDPIE